LELAAQQNPSKLIVYYFPTITLIVYNIFQKKVESTFFIKIIFYNELCQHLFRENMRSNIFSKHFHQYFHENIDQYFFNVPTFFRNSFPIFLVFSSRAGGAVATQETWAGARQPPCSRGGAAADRDLRDGADGGLWSLRAAAMVGSVGWTAKPRESPAMASGARRGLWTRAVATGSWRRWAMFAVVGLFGLLMDYYWWIIISIYIIFRAIYIYIYIYIYIHILFPPVTYHGDLVAVGPSLGS
jgi:hypothetical protein